MKINSQSFDVAENETFLRGLLKGNFRDCIMNVHLVYQLVENSCISSVLIKEYQLNAAKISTENLWDKFVVEVLNWGIYLAG